MIKKIIQNEINYYNSMKKIFEAQDKIVCTKKIFYPEIMSCLSDNDYNEVLCDSIHNKEYVACHQSHIQSKELEEQYFSVYWSISGLLFLMITFLSIGSFIAYKKKKQKNE